MGKFLIMPQGRLQEWVAEEQGYFTAEGLDYTFVYDFSTETSGASNGVEPSEVREVRQGAFESMEAGRACEVSSACHWAVNFVGRPMQRLGLLLNRKVTAANVFGIPLYVLEQQGFRKVVDTTFMIGFLVSMEAQEADVHRYFRALQRAQRDIDQAPERYKHYFLKALPEHYHAMVDVHAFGPGERLVFEPYTQDIFEHTHRWVASWEIFPAEPDSSATYTSAVLL
jgi:hypothetical protein